MMIILILHDDHTDSSGLAIALIPIPIVSLALKPGCWVRLKKSLSKASDYEYAELLTMIAGHY